MTVISIYFGNLPCRLVSSCILMSQSCHANEREQDSLVKWEQKSHSLLVIQSCTTEVSIFSVWMQQWHLLRIVFINMTTQYIVT